MATKKQKHAAAMEKRERMIAAERKVGLDALERDRQRRAKEAARVELEANRKKNKGVMRLIAGAPIRHSENNLHDLEVS